MFRKCSLERFETYSRNAEARISLDLSTHPLGPSPKIMECLGSVTISDLWKYPEKFPQLKEELAAFAGVDEKNVMITAGAEQGIEVCLTRLLDPRDPVAIMIPTFPLFRSISRTICDASVIQFKSLDSIPRAKVIVLCSPNNPTTEEISRKEVRAVLEDNSDSVVILDNVFSLSGKERFEPLLKEFSNLIILRSFSKDFALAGIRVGFLLAPEESISVLGSGSCHFRVSQFSQKIALSALKDKLHLSEMKKFLESESSFIIRNLGKRVIRHSSTPFFLFDCGMDSSIFREKMMGEGISIVDSRPFPGLDSNFCRVAIGSRRENQAFVSAARKILEI